MRGRKRDKTYTSTHGGDCASSKVKLLHAMERGPVSVQERRVSPSQDEMQRAIANGECPFCGERFKNIAAHTNRTHGIDRFELKEIVGIPKSRPACSEDFTKICSERSKRQMDENPAHRESLVNSVRAKTRNYSTAGRKVQLAKLDKAHDAQDVVEMGRQTTLKRRAQTKERDDKILSAYNSGATLTEIMDDLDVTAQVVNGALRFYGIKRPDFRSRRKVPATTVEALSAAGKEWAKRRTAARLSRWDSSDKSRSTLRSIAEEWGQSATSVATFLRAHGREVVDGRTDPGRLRKPSQQQVRIARFRELGGDFAAVRILADELGLRVQGLSQYLRNAGEVFDDGRTVGR